MIYLTLVKVLQTLKKILDDIKEGIKYGALDENIVAAELSAVLRAIT